MLDAVIFCVTAREPVIMALPVTSRFAFGTALPTPTLLPVTTRAFVLYAPITTLSSLNTSNTDNPDTSLTLIKLPLRLSTMSKSEPLLPMNVTVPSCNTSRLMLAEPTLLEKNIFGLLLPDVAR